ncbi:response regulator [Clostridium sp. MCC353]|uniref:response regulator transcription factor n=1 Tax=Clostridium sp. MCC353 TaxID=2592646 RepID=UPI001C034EBE|nr:response regulator [Clostridium sp. MCC353]MBT9777981.1 response regulator [Clostridium sp. MCC353]
MYQVLVVDDEMIERMALARKLKKHFGDTCQVIQAENGLEALRMFQENSIQIVIMDIGMPGMNGVEAAEQIRKLDKGAVIIFLTAYDEFSYAKRAISIRALEYLLKPCDDEELLPVIEEAMRQAGMNAEFTEPEQGVRFEEAAGQDEEINENRINQIAGILREYVKNHYMEEISMQDAARAMNYSDAYFCKLFKQCFGQNFTAYLTQVRMNEAKKMLQNKAVNIKDVSSGVGYTDSKYFSKVFKRMTGMLPSEYRTGYNVQK